MLVACLAWLLRIASNNTKDHYSRERQRRATIPEQAKIGPKDRQEGLEWIDQTIMDSGLRGNVEKRIIEANNIAAGLVRAAADYDLLVLGASKEGIFSSVLFGEIPEKVARYSTQPVMIVRRYEGLVKSLVRRVMG